MQWEFQAAHTQISDLKNSETQKLQASISSKFKVQLMALTVSWATYHSQSVPVAFSRFYMFLSD